MAYCPKCGNAGILVNGEPCDCKLNTDFLFNGLVCMDIPEQYQGMSFNPALIAEDMGDAYRNFMSNMYDSITSMKWKFRNILICSPPSRSKTTLAYCVIQTLFRKGIETFPVYDVNEIKRIMTDMDFSRKQTYSVKDPEKLYTAPYLFAKIPALVSLETYDTMATLLDRRVRRGNATIFIYNGTWESLVRLDSMGVLTSLLGDGSYGTLENKTWRKVKE